MNIDTSPQSLASEQLNNISASHVTLHQRPDDQNTNNTILQFLNPITAAQEALHFGTRAASQIVAAPVHQVQRLAGWALTPVQNRIHALRNQTQSFNDNLEVLEQRYHTSLDEVQTSSHAIADTIEATSHSVSTLMEKALKTCMKLGTIAGATTSTNHLMNLLLVSDTPSSKAPLISKALWTISAAGMLYLLHQLAQEPEVNQLKQAQQDIPQHSAALFRTAGDISGHLSRDLGAIIENQQEILNQTTDLADQVSNTLNTISGSGPTD